MVRIVEANGSLSSLLTTCQALKRVFPCRWVGLGGGGAEVSVMEWKMEVAFEVAKMISLTKQETLLISTKATSKVTQSTQLAAIFGVPASPPALPTWRPQGAEGLTSS